MPSTPRGGPSGLSVATPRYYDYTEGFESGPTRTATPIHPLAPVPTRAANYSRPMVLQESDDSLDAAFGEGDSAFFEHEGRNSRDIDIARTPHLNGTPHAESPRAAQYRPPSRCQTGSIRSESRSTTFDAPDTSRKFGRGSDIDLLPSQAGRDSMDTFNPSLDLESKDAPTYRYTDYRATTTPKTKKSSPERQVQVQGGETTSVRSEQGVILRDDTQDEILQESVGQYDTADKMRQKSTDSPQENAAARRSVSEPVQNLAKDPTQHNALLDGRYKSVTMGRDNSQHKKASTVLNEAIRASLDNTNHDTGSGNDKGSAATEDTGNEGDNVGGDGIMPVATEKALVAAPRQRFNHKRSRAVPRISTSSLPREDNEGYPHIPPSCSTTPIVSPKPISPARQLKLKNSIPQLMKALPSLPGDPGYVSPSAPSIQSTSSNECDFAEVLSPFKFSESSTPWLSRSRETKESVSMPECDQNLGPQKSVPKLRLRMKMSNDSGASVSSDARVFETSSDRHGSPSTPTSKVEGYVPDSGDRVRARNRLKLRYSRSTTLNTPAPETIRRNADASASSIIADISSQRPRDLFTLPPSPSPAASPACENALQPTQTRCSSAGSTLDAADSNRTAYPLILGDRPSNLTCDVRSMETCFSSDAGHRQGFKGHLSNLRFLLSRSSDTESDKGSMHYREEHRADQDVDLAVTNATSKHSFASRRRSSRGKRKRATLRRRMRAKLLKWVKDAKTVVRVCAKRNHGA